VDNEVGKLNRRLSELEIWLAEVSRRSLRPADKQACANLRRYLLHCRLDASKWESEKAALIARKKVERYANRLYTRVHGDR
jgi:hypothetical protein